MIDWAARATTVFSPTSKDRPPNPTEPAHLVPEDVDASVLAVPLEGKSQQNSPLSTLDNWIDDAFMDRKIVVEFDGETPRLGAKAHAERLLGILARREAWTPSDIEDGREAITRNSWDAATLFVEMLMRLPEDKDDRVRCVECKNLRYGHCRQHLRAGLMSSEVGQDLAALHQHCASFRHQLRP